MVEAASELNSGAPIIGSLASEILKTAAQKATAWSNALELEPS